MSDTAKASNNRRKGEFAMKEYSCPVLKFTDVCVPRETICDGSGVWPGDWDSGLIPED